MIDRICYHSPWIIVILSSTVLSSKADTKTVMRWFQVGTDKKVTLRAKNRGDNAQGHSRLNQDGRYLIKTVGRNYSLGTVKRGCRPAKAPISEMIVQYAVTTFHAGRNSLVQK